MEELTLQANMREILGKKVSTLRRQGLTPAHVFGHGVASLALQCDTVILKKIIARAGMTRLIKLTIDHEETPKSVFIREIQRDAIGKHLLHVDFYEVIKGEKITADIPIVLVGEAPAMKGKGRMLVHGITSLSIECLPEKVPPRIEVDLSTLEELEQAIHVSDIILDPDITVDNEPEQLVVKVSEAMVKAEEEVVEAVAAEGAEAEAVAPGAEAPQEPKGGGSKEA